MQKKVSYYEKNSSIPCPDCPLNQECIKRVLIVGGPENAQNSYRKLIKNIGAQIRFHDGSSNRGLKKLENDISWSDIVFCPIPINSHRACLGVKSYCSKINKPYFFLRSAGVSTLARELEKLINA